MTLRTFHDDTERTPRNPRLNLLLSYRLGEDAPVMEQLPRLLSPMGIQTVRVTTAQDAAEAITVRPIHIAVVDLTVPFADAGGTKAAGPRLLQLLRRLEEPPPTVVVRPRQASARASARGLTEALREGAFTVLDRPLHLESMLEVMRRILRRHYAGRWPTVGRPTGFTDTPDTRDTPDTPESPDTP